MPYSSGTFSRVHDFTDDRDNGIRIQASRMDAEMDGIATGLSTALLKDGTQTATAKIPFAVGLSVIDNQTILLGTNSDIAIQYDETTNDSLEISANVEGAALGIVLKSDQGDDNADQHKLSIADGGTLTLGSKISGSFVSYLTHTPNSTVASSTLAVAGNLTVGGNLTLGSGAELSEAELEMLDGITAGTVAASKAVVVDANKDIASFRNVTLTGELDAGSLDVSGDVDIDGTLETDALSIASTAVTATAAELNYNDTGAAVGTVVASKTVTVDANKDVSSFRNITLTGELDAGSLDVSGDADIDGTLEADAMTLNGTAITTVATLSTGISNGNLPVFTSGVADDDFLRVNGTSIEGRSASEVLSDIGASAVAGSSSIVTTGALDSGSITSGFGAIDNGTSGIRTNTFTAETSFVPDAQDGASLGTSSLQFSDLFLADGAVTAYGDDGEVTLTHVADTGLLLSDASGVGTTKLMFGDSGTFVHQESDGTLTVESDTTLKLKGGTVLIQGANGSSMGTFSQGGTAVLSFNNSARLSAVDAGIDVVGIVTANTFEPTGDTSAGDNAAIGYTAAEGLILTGQGSTSDITVKNDADATVFTVPTGTDDILFPDNAKAMFGAGSDLQIYHTGAQSFISDQGTGSLILLTNQLDINNAGNTENMITATSDGAVNLYHNNSKKFETTSSGVTVTGGLTTTTASSIEGGVVFNESSADVDFRVESNGNTHAIMVQAGSDCIGIKTASPNDYYADDFVVTADNQGGITIVGGTSDTGQYLAFADGTSGSNRFRGYLQYAHDTNSMIFATDGAEKARISSSGVLMLGKTSADATGSKIELASEANNVLAVYMIKKTQVEMTMGFKASTDTNFYMGTGSSNVGTNGVYLSNTATSWTSNSDFRKKKNLVAIENALDKIANCRAMTGHFNHEKDDAKKRPFLIAQDWVTALPEAVDQDTKDDDGNENLGLSYDGTIPLLVACIKELREQNIALTARIIALEGA